MSDKTAKENPVQVYFNEDGSVSAVWVRLNVAGHYGELPYLEFEGHSVDLLAFYPEDVNEVDGEFTPINTIVLPEKPHE
jgi:hypothetical protein